jgi:transposase
MFPFLKTLFADGGYQGPQFAKVVAKVHPHLNVEIVKRSDQVGGFVMLPKRWIVERTIAWLNRCRRLAKDWENLNRKALAFLRLASIRLMLRKLCNQPRSLRTDSKQIKSLILDRVRKKMRHAACPLYPE